MWYEYHKIQPDAYEIIRKKARASTFSSQTKHITRNDLVDCSLKTKSIYFALNYTSSKDFWIVQNEKKTSFRLYQISRIKNFRD